MPSEFNFQLLVIGRYARGVSQAELAKKAGVEQSYLSKIENGLREPSREVVERLGEALCFPPSFFMQNDPVHGLPLSVHSMFRKKASMGKRKLERIRAELNIRLLHIRRLLNSVDFSSELPLPEIDADEYPEGAKEVANIVRRLWLLPPGPILSLTECLERAGILVVCCDFYGAPISGVTMMLPDLPPCIFLNKDDPADRQRLTLAHELGHVIMHRIPSQKMEEEAFAFGSAFLMPTSDIRPKLTGPLNLPRLAVLKKIWRVSMQALLYRAEELGTITRNQSRYLWMQFNQLNIRMREPSDLVFPKEEPKVLPKILQLHIEELGYNISELAQSLHLYEDELGEMYPPLCGPGPKEHPRPERHLRIISK